MKYDDMIPKIAKYSAVIIFLIQFFFIQAYPEILPMYEYLSRGYVIVWQGLSFGVVMLILPGLWFFLEEHFRVHNKVAEWFRLREWYDFHVIMKEFLDKLDIEGDKERIKSNREVILSKVYYSYVGFYIETPLDPHLLSEVVRRLQFYWIIQNALFVTILFTFIGLGISFSFNGFQILLVSEALVFYISFKRMKELSKKQVNLILEDPERMKEVKDKFEEILDAL